MQREKEKGAPEPAQIFLHHSVSGADASLTDVFTFPFTGDNGTYLALNLGLFDEIHVEDVEEEAVMAVIE